MLVVSVGASVPKMDAPIFYLHRVNICFRIWARCARTALYVLSAVLSVCFALMYSVFTPLYLQSVNRVHFLSHEKNGH